MIEILNALFDAQAIAIRDHGGEILKFIGDGILAVFPIEDMATIPNVARDVVAAAQAALAAVRRLADEPPLEIVVALHIGMVNYAMSARLIGSTSPSSGRRSILSAGSREWRSPRSADSRQQRLRAGARRRGGLVRPAPSARVGNVARVVRPGLTGVGIRECRLRNA
jgi:hypothetical protein